jgi:hypothetical protein
MKYLNKIDTIKIQKTNVSYIQEIFYSFNGIDTKIGYIEFYQDYFNITLLETNFSNLANIKIELYYLLITCTDETLSRITRFLNNNTRLYIL